MPDANVNAQSAQDQTAVDTAQNQDSTTQQPAQNPGEDLANLDKSKLVEMVLETRTEAKNRRHKAKELEQKLNEIQQQIQLKNQAELESKQEFEKLYNETKEKYKDYEELKSFKTNYLEKCQNEIDKILPTLTSEQTQYFETASSGRPADEKLALLQGLKNLTNSNNGNTQKTDNTQSTGRAGNVGNPGITFPAVPFASGNEALNIQESLKNAPSF